MRGAFSDADELADAALLRALFPASPYRFVSGGDPEHIPELSYEAFVDSHRRFYSPSNAYVFLDGAVDIDAALSLLCASTSTAPCPARASPRLRRRGASRRPARPCATSCPATRRAKSAAVSTGAAWPRTSPSARS